MPWFALAGAAISAAPGLIGGSKGSQGPRNINFENVNADPWSVEQYNNANTGLQNQQAFANQTAQQNGLQNQSNVFQQQQGLANQLGQQAAGQGPNPAQAQLAQNTGNNVQQQSALMGSQRGVSQNAGLLARQAAQQGAGIQQQGVGQAATLQAQQQIAAQQALMQQQASMQGVAGQQVGQQANALNSAQTAAQNLYGTQSQNVANWNSGQVTAATGASNNAAAYGMQQLKGDQAMAGGGMNGMGAALSLFGKGAAPAAETSGIASGGNANATDWSNWAQSKASGGTISGYAQGGPVSAFGQYCNMKSGGPVQGQAQVAGNSAKNDTVPAMLSPGEVVIDRETLTSNDKAGKAARFLQAYLAKKNRK